MSKSTKPAPGFDDVLRKMLSTPPQTLAESVKPAKKAKAKSVDRARRKS
jgi:hypothetical protein